MLIPEECAIRALLERLNEKAENAVLVVEGKQDQAALSKFIQADFCQLSKKDLWSIAEEIAARSKEAVLLLDADKKGRKLTKMLSTYLQQNGVKVDTKLGLKLLRVTNCHNVQGLKKMLDKLGENYV